MEVSTRPQRHWTLIAHVDATRRDLEPSATRETVEIQNGVPADMTALVQLRRKGSHLGLQKTLAALEMAALPAGLIVAGALAVTGLGLPALAVASLAYNSVALGATAAIDGYKRWHLMNEIPKYHQEPAWSGTRTFRMDHAAPGESIRLKSPEVRLGPGLGELISHGMAYKADHVAVLISGHGDGYRMVAGMTPEQIRGELAKTGQKVDLLVLEACKMGNLESLKGLGEYARFAVVSQDEMWQAGLPWSYILPRMEQYGGDARQLGESLVRITGGLDQVPTLALIDLEKVDPLIASVEKLARTLDPDDPAVRSAFNETQVFPRRPRATWPGVLSRLQEVWITLRREVLVPDLGDLGGFLAGLQKHSTDPAVLAAAAETEKLLGETVLLNQVHKSLQGKASGLTVRMPTPIFFHKKYAEDTGMTGWGEMLREMQPWRTQLANTVVGSVWPYVPFVPKAFGS